MVSKKKTDNLASLASPYQTFKLFLSSCKTQITSSYSFTDESFTSHQTPYWREKARYIYKKENTRSVLDDGGMRHNKLAIDDKTT